VTQLVQCLFLIALGGIIWNLRRDATQNPFVLWTWAWVVAMTVSFFVSEFRDDAIVSLLIPLFPAFLLAGALSYSHRAIPRWLLPAAIGLGGVRLALYTSGLQDSERALGLAFEPAMAFFAGYLVYSAQHRPASLSQKLLPFTFVLLGANQATVGVLRLIGTNPEALIAWCWILAVPPSISIQALACHRWNQARQREEREKGTQIRKALGTSQVRFRSLTENSSQLILELDAEGRIEYANPRVTELLGYPHSVLEGRHLRDFVHPDDEDGSKNLVASSSEELSPPEAIRRWRTSGGDWRWVESVIRPFPGKDGQSHWVVSASDVSERRRLEAQLRKSRDELEVRVEERTEELSQVIQQLKREIAERETAETALRKSERRYRVVSELSADWSFEFSVSKAGSMSPDWAQGNLVEITGLTTDRLLGGGYFSIVHPDDRLSVKEQFKALLKCAEDASQEILESQHRLLTAEGEIRWLHSIMEAEAGPNGEVRVIGAARDITDERAAEEEHRRLDDHLRDVQRLESLGVLADRIAHGFNNQLTVILGNSSLALSEVPSDTPLHERLQRIRAAAQQSASLTEQMEVYAGKSIPSLKSIHLPHLIEKIRELLEASISRHCTLHLDIANPLPLVEGDEGQLHQVAVNLVTNASEALSQKQGNTWLRVGAMHADRSYLAQTFGTPGLEAGEFVYLEVEDDGSGISPEDRGRIFELFFTTRFSGRGLGLAAVLGIVQAHAGAIKLQSEIGQGTCIRVLFPAVESQAVSRQNRTPKQPHGERVLVVDDDEAVRDLMTELLSRAGFEVSSACDGFEALERVRSETDSIAVILLDIDMPGPDGGQTLRAIRELQTDVPVVITSAFEESEILRRIGDQKIAGLVLKPFDEHELTETIQDAIESRN